MGRAKLKMELIRNEKSRNITFKRRKEVLLRKIYELTTLCDVDACMIIYRPKQKHGNFAEPEIFPQDPNEVKRMIGVYNAKSKDSGSNKNFTLTAFYKESKHKVEEELAKVRQKNLEAKAQLENLVTEAGGLHFHDVVTKKAEYVRESLKRIKMKNMPKSGGVDGMNNNNKKKKTGMEFTPARMGHNFYGPSSFIPPMGVVNNPPPIQFPVIEHHQNQEMHLDHKSSMMRLLLTGNEYHAIGQSNGSYQQQAVFLEPATGLDARVMYHNERTMARYYTAAQTTPYMQIQPSQHMQFVPNQHIVTGGGNEEEQNIVQYQMNNNVARFHYG